MHISVLFFQGMKQDFLASTGLLLVTNFLKLSFRFWRLQTPDLYFQIMLLHFCSALNLTLSENALTGYSKLEIRKMFMVLISFTINWNILLPVFKEVRIFIFILQCLCMVLLRFPTAYITSQKGFNVN